MVDDKDRGRAMTDAPELVRARFEALASRRLSAVPE
jgi:hypothetical protein